MGVFRFNCDPTIPNLAQSDLLISANNIKADKRVLFVVSEPDQEDWSWGAVFAPNNKYFRLITDLFAASDTNMSSFNWAAVSLDAYYYAQGVGGIKPELEDADHIKYISDAIAESNTNRLLKLIEKHNPTDIVTFGKDAHAVFLEYSVLPYASKMQPSNWVGCSVPCAINGNLFKVWALPDPMVMLTSEAAKRTSNLLGFVARTLDYVVNGNPYLAMDYNIVDGAFVPSVDLTSLHKKELVDTIDKFDALMEKVRNAPVVSIDSEGPNLNRIATKLDIIQFAVDSTVGYVVPFEHKDAPWSPSEREYIRQEMADYFFSNDADYHIYHNASHDLPVLRARLRFSHYCADIWDLMAGEYALDENMADLGIYLRSLNPDRKGGFHNLQNLTCQYGCPVYLMGEFGKESRIGIHLMSLTTPGLLDYCAYDVTIPFFIHEKQRQRAYDVGYLGFDLVVRHTISDQLNMFGNMQFMGEQVDVNELFDLNMPDSPLYTLIRAEEQALRETDEVKKAVALLFDANQKNLTGSWADDDVILNDNNSFNFTSQEHLGVLFDKVMHLTSDDVTKSGKQSYGKGFKLKNQGNQLVGRWTDLVKAQKLKQAFLTPLIKIITTNPDSQTDQRVRSSYHFVNIVTGRIASTDPNLQQIPQHSAIAKLIKHLFIAREGSLFIKVDYSAHELRGWSIISGCQDLARAFQRGLDLLGEFRKLPDAELARRFETEGDIHRQNASLFFGVLVTEVTKVLRNAVKGISFGSIYGRSIDSIAKSLAMPVEEVQKVYDAFFERLPVAANWLHGIEDVAQRLLYVESPLHRRRHLWGFLGADREDKRTRGLFNALCRRARNSPIQGMGSDLGFTGARLLEKLVWLECKDEQRYFERLPLRTCNMVHDSNEIEVDYDWVMRALTYIEFALTTGNQWKVLNIYGMEFTVDMAIEMEIGPRLSKMEKWAPGVEDIYELGADGKPIKDEKGKPVVIGHNLLGDFNHLHEIIKSALEHQKNKMGHNIDVDAVLATIFDPRYTPDFLLQEVDRGSFDPELAEKYGYYDYLDVGTRTKFNGNMVERMNAGEFDQVVYKYAEYADKYKDYEADRRVKLKVPKVAH